jgi:diaminopimelate decarboxylase
MTSRAVEIALNKGVEPPAYVYDLDEVGTAHDRLRAALPPACSIYYSVKANPHPAIIHKLTRLGCDLEVSSPGELAQGRASGVEPSRLLYTGPARRDEDLMAALTAGVRWFSVESPASLDQLNRLAGSAGRVAQCLLRINPMAPGRGQSIQMTGVPSQFGADQSWVLRRPDRFASRDAARVMGFHIYLGSNVSEEAALIEQFAGALACAAEVAAAVGVAPNVLDLGGGFGAPFGRDDPPLALPTLRSRLSSLLDTHAPGWRRSRPRVAFESGRFLTAGCGSLVTRVLEIKRSRDRVVVILESGINHVGGMSGLRRLPQLSLSVRRAAARTGQPERDRAPTSAALIVGPLCTPLDTLARSADLGRLEPGDVVRVPNVGAYGLTASLVAFLGHPLPREAVVEHGELVDVSRLELVRRSDW